MEIARKNEFARMWLSEVTEAKATLEAMSVGEMKQEGAEEIGHLEPLSAVVRERLDDIARQTS